MGILNNNLGFNLTDENPIINSPFNESVELGYVNPPPGSEYMITETGLYMLTEDGLNLMITE